MKNVIILTIGMVLSGLAYADAYDGTLEEAFPEMYNNEVSTSVPEVGDSSSDDLLVEIELREMEISSEETAF